MSDDNDTSLTPISNARSLEEIAEFWDTHSLADYWDQTHEVEIEVQLETRHRVTIDPELYARLVAEARMRGVLPETLVNVWMAERLTQKRPD